MSNLEDSAVKVDKALLKKVEEFVEKNKFTYSSKKQVVNLAILEFLNFRNSQKKRISESFKNQKILDSHRKSNFRDYKKPLLRESFLNLHSLNKSSKKKKNEHKRYFR